MSTLKKETSPTRAELEILEILWQKGPSTVRAVNDSLNQQKNAGQYTSTLKLMQIMLKKGLLVRDESEMKHVYKAAAGEKKTKSLMLDQFIKLIYNGYPSKLVIELLGNKKTSKKELNEIKDYLKNMDAS